MNITVYGTGCPKCKKLSQNTISAAEELDLEFELEKIEDINEIVESGIMRTPALGINEKIVSEGKVLNIERIKELLS